MVLAQFFSRQSVDSNHSKKSKNLDQFPQTDPQRKISYVMILHFKSDAIMRRYERKDSENYPPSLSLVTTSSMECCNRAQNLGYGTRKPRSLSPSPGHRSARFPHQYFSYFTPFFSPFPPVGREVPGYVSRFSQER